MIANFKRFYICSIFIIESFKLSHPLTFVMIKEFALTGDELPQVRRLKTKKIIVAIIVESIVVALLAVNLLMLLILSKDVIFYEKQFNQAAFN